MNPNAKLWEFVLYIAGNTDRSQRALANLTRYCDQYLTDAYSFGIVDLMKNPQLAERDQIVTIPTLVRIVPQPNRRIVGDLSNEAKVLTFFNIASTSL